MSNHTNSVLAHREALAEGAGENVFNVKDGVVCTPDLSGGALDGITRDEVCIADEAFVTGTAGEVTPIRELDRNPIGSGRRGPVTERIQLALFDIVHGRDERCREWLSPVAPGCPRGCRTCPLAPVVPVRDAAGPVARVADPAAAGLCGGVGLLSFGIGCVMAFAPVVPIRQMGATPLLTGNLMRTATFTASLLGLVLAQGGTRRARAWVGDRRPAVALLGAAVASSCAAAARLLAGSPTTLFIGVGVFLNTTMAGTLLLPPAAQDMTPRPLRARLVSIIATLNIVLGALGPAAVGAVSDRLAGHPQGPLMAMAGCATAGLLGAIAFLLPLTRLYLGAVRAARVG